MTNQISSSFIRAAAAVTPGAYLRQCREDAGLSLHDVALCTETLPAVCARSRAEWLATIEEDVAPLAVPTLLRLHAIFLFDWEVLLTLCAAAPEAQEADDPGELRMCLRDHGRAIVQAAAAAASAADRTDPLPRIFATQGGTH